MSGAAGKDYTAEVAPHSVALLRLAPGNGKTRAPGKKHTASR